MDRNRLIIGAWLNWYLVAGRLRVHTEIQNNALTLPDYFTSRFGDKKKVIRIISALVILIFFGIYCASGMVAGARLFESIFCYELHHCSLGQCDCNHQLCVYRWLPCDQLDGYISSGLMIFALLLAPIMTFLAVGDLQHVNQLIETARPHAANMFQGVSFIAIISSMAWGLGYFGQPHILVRFMAADSVKTIPNARRIGMAWMILCLAGAVAVGYVGIAYSKHIRTFRLLQLWQKIQKQCLWN